MEARALLAPVYASFTEGFGFPDLVEARALPEDFGAAPAPAGSHPSGEDRPRADPDAAAGPPPAR